MAPPSEELKVIPMVPDSRPEVPAPLHRGLPGSPSSLLLPLRRGTQRAVSCPFAQTGRKPM